MKCFKIYKSFKKGSCSIHLNTLAEMHRKITDKCESVTSCHRIFSQWLLHLLYNKTLSQWFCKMLYIITKLIKKSNRLDWGNKAVSLKSKTSQDDHFPKKKSPNSKQIKLDNWYERQKAPKIPLKPGIKEIPVKDVPRFFCEGYGKKKKGEAMMQTWWNLKSKLSVSLEQEVKQLIVRCQEGCVAFIHRERLGAPGQAEIEGGTAWYLMNQTNRLPLSWNSGPGSWRGGNVLTPHPFPPCDVTRGVDKTGKVRNRNKSSSNLKSAVQCKGTRKHLVFRA